MLSTSLQDTLARYGLVWYHPTGIANILSLSRVCEKYRITFDSEIENKLMVIKPDGTTFEFLQLEHGLYYLDTNSPPSGYMMISTVAGKWSNYTNADYLCALAATGRKLQIKIGNPST